MCVCVCARARACVHFFLLFFFCRPERGNCYGGFYFACFAGRGKTLQSVIVRAIFSEEISPELLLPCPSPATTCFASVEKPTCLYRTGSRFRVQKLLTRFGIPHITRTHTHTRAHACTHVHARTHARTYTHTHTHTHAHTRAREHTHTRKKKINRKINRSIMSSRQINKRVSKQRKEAESGQFPPLDKQERIQRQQCNRNQPARHPEHIK